MHRCSAAVVRHAAFVLLVACAEPSAASRDAGPVNDGSQARPSASSSDAAAHRDRQSDTAAVAPSPAVDAEAPDAGPPDGDAGAPTPEGGLGPVDAAAMDPASNGGTITFEQIGAVGWYPSRRDPQLGPCDAFDQDGCCMARNDVDSDRLTPWNEDLILTLRGPMQVAQFAAYQPAGADVERWALVSSWDARAPASARGVAFRGNDTQSSGFGGSIGSECLVDVSTNRPFSCGPGSIPFCPAAERHLGWAGSKLLVLLAEMPHAGDPGSAAPCSDANDGNWYDAPWIGLSLGELVRAGAFSSCHCYARDPSQWWLGDGCGQLNAFEVVNDNDDYTNLEVFSTNFFGYGGYVGEGPCGSQCDVSRLDPQVDLIDKAASAEAATGAVATPSGGPGAAFRRPTAGHRYFVILLHEATRTVQLAIIHPARIPPAAAPLLPALPSELGADAIGELIALRLPR